MRKKLGELLVERGAITRAQLQEALTLQRQNGMRLGMALLHLDHLSEPQLVEALSHLFGIQQVNLRQTRPDPEAVAAIPARFASEHDLFPYRLRRERGRRVLTVAMSDPMDFRIVDEIGFMSNARIEPRLAGPSQIDLAIRREFGTRFGQGPEARQPVYLRKDSESGTMTILRPGGDEEKVHTGTRSGARRPRASTTDDAPVAPMQSGPAPAPSTPGSAPASLGRAPEAPRPEPSPTPALPPPAPSTLLGVKPRAPMAREESAILLTEEVSSSFPVAKVEVQSLPPKPPPLPAKGPPHSPEANGTTHLGALVGASGQAVDADAVLKLERRFWALMRVLSKRGLLTKEEFMKELGEEGWS